MMDDTTVVPLLIGDDTWGRSLGRRVELLLEGPVWSGARFPPLVTGPTPGAIFPGLGFLDFDEVPRGFEGGFC